MTRRSCSPPSATGSRRRALRCSSASGRWTPSKLVSCWARSPSSWASACRPHPTAATTPVSAGTVRDLMDHGHQPDLDHIRQLAARLAATGPGPAADLAVEIAAALSGLSGRIDALWQLISAVVESAGLSV